MALFDSALDKTFHQQCFRCAQCSLVLTGGYVLKGAQALCNLCANMRKCSKCLLPIPGGTSYLELDGLSFHQHCVPAGILY